MIQSRSLVEHLKNSTYIKKVYQYQNKVLQDIYNDIQKISTYLTNINNNVLNDPIVTNTMIDNIRNVIISIDEMIQQSSYNGIKTFTWQQSITYTQINNDNNISLSNSFNGLNFSAHTLTSYIIGSSMLGYDIENSLGPTISVGPGTYVRVGYLFNNSQDILTLYINTIYYTNGPNGLLSFLNPGDIYLYSHSTPSTGSQIASNEEIYFQIISTSGNEIILKALKAISPTSLINNTTSKGADDQDYWASPSVVTFKLCNFLINKFPFDQWATYKLEFAASYVNRLVTASKQISNYMSKVNNKIQNVDYYNNMIQERINGTHLLEQFFHPTCTDSDSDSGSDSENALNSSTNNATNKKSDTDSNTDTDSDSDSDSDSNSDKKHHHRHHHHRHHNKHKHHHNKHRH
jgi:hypothetical protein